MGFESELGRVVFTVLIMVLIVAFAFLPQRREKKRQQRNRLYTQNIARQHLARARANTDGASGRSATNPPVLFASGPSREDPSDRIT